MILQIDDTKTINDVQERFSLCFPLLKIEFCRKKHGWEDICPESQFISSYKTIASVRKIHNPGTFEIKSWFKVGEVEKEFYRKFGLYVQICYKCGRKWIQTGKSDNISLDSLQKKAFDRPVVGLL